MVEIIKSKRPLSALRNAAGTNEKPVKIKLKFEENCLTERNSSKKDNKEISLDQIELLEKIGALVKNNIPYYPQNIEEIEYFVMLSPELRYSSHYSKPLGTGISSKELEARMPKEVQDFGLQAYKNNIHLTAREECVVLLDWINNMILKHGNTKLLETEKEKTLRNIQIILSFAITEILRMTKIECVQRAAVLKEIWNCCLNLTKILEEWMFSSQKKLNKTWKNKYDDLQNSTDSLISKLKYELSKKTEDLNWYKKRTKILETQQNSIEIECETLKNRACALTGILDHLALKSVTDTKKYNKKQKKMMIELIRNIQKDQAAIINNIPNDGKSPTNKNSGLPEFEKLKNELIENCSDNENSNEISKQDEKKESPKNEKSTLKIIGKLAESKYVQTSKVFQIDQNLINISIYNSKTGVSKQNDEILYNDNDLLKHQESPKIKENKDLLDVLPPRDNNYRKYRNFRPQNQTDNSKTITKSAQNSYYNEKNSENNKEIEIKEYIEKKAPEYKKILNQYLENAIPNEIQSQIFKNTIELFTGNLQSEEIKQHVFEENSDLLIKSREISKCTSRSNNTKMPIKANEILTKPSENISIKLPKEAYINASCTSMISAEFGDDYENSDIHDIVNIKFEDPQTELPKKLMAAMNSLSEKISNLKTDEYGEWVLDITQDNDLVNGIVKNGHLLTLLLRNLYKKKVKLENELSDIRLFDIGTQYEQIYTSEILANMVTEGQKIINEKLVCDKYIQVNLIEPNNPTVKNTDKSLYSKYAENKEKILENYKKSVENNEKSQEKSHEKSSENNEKSQEKSHEKSLENNEKSQEKSHEKPVEKPVENNEKFAEKHKKSPEPKHKIFGFNEKSPKGKEKSDSVKQKIQYQNSFKSNNSYTIARPFNLGKPSFIVSATTNSHPGLLFLHSFVEKVEQRDPKYLNAIPLSLRQLMKTIIQIYAEKLQNDKDVTSMRHQPLAAFIYEFYVNKYGLLNFAERKLKEMLLAVVLYRNREQRIELFSRFIGLSNIFYTPDDLLFLFHFVQQVAFK